MEHVQGEGIPDMCALDEMLAIDPDLRLIGSIGSKRQEEVQRQELPKSGWEYKELFEGEEGKIIAPRRTSDHAIDLKDGATAPWGPIYPIWAYQLEEPNQYLNKIRAEGKIVYSKYLEGAPILIVPRPDGRLRRCMDY